AQALAQVAGYACGRFGEAVSPHRYALWRNPSGDDVVPFAFRPDDDSRRAAHDSAIERRVEPTLQTNLAQARPEHSERFEHIGHAPEPAPRVRARRHGITEAEDVHQIGPWRTTQHERKRRRDRHPAVPERCADVMN